MKLIKKRLKKILSGAASIGAVATLASTTVITLNSNANNESMQEIQRNYSESAMSKDVSNLGITSLIETRGNEPISPIPTNQPQIFYHNSRVLLSSAYSDNNVVLNSHKINEEFVAADQIVTGNIIIPENEQVYGLESITFQASNGYGQNNPNFNNNVLAQSQNIDLPFGGQKLNNIKITGIHYTIRYNDEGRQAGEWRYDQKAIFTLTSIDFVAPVATNSNGVYTFDHTTLEAIGYNTQQAVSGDYLVNQNGKHISSHDERMNNYGHAAISLKNEFGLPDGQKLGTFASVGGQLSSDWIYHQYDQTVFDGSSVVNLNNTSATVSQRKRNTLTENLTVNVNNQAYGNQSASNFKNIEWNLSSLKTRLARANGVAASKINLESFGLSYHISTHYQWGVTGAVFNYHDAWQVIFSYVSTIQNVSFTIV